MLALSIESIPPFPSQPRWSHQSSPQGLPKNHHPIPGRTRLSGVNAKMTALEPLEQSRLPARLGASRLASHRGRQQGGGSRRLAPALRLLAWPLAQSPSAPRGSILFWGGSHPAGNPSLGTRVGSAPSSSWLSAN